MDRPSPLVSIVTPTFNQAAYLAETIESVLAQDYAHIEYVVVNDGSTDETAEILRRYSDRVKIIEQDNAGQSDALNRGFRESRGELIGYLSSDDLLRANCVSTVVSKFLNAEEAIVVYPDYDLIDAIGEVIRKVVTEDFDRKRLVEDLVCQPGPGAFFKREAYETVGGWRSHLERVPDFDFWLRLSSLGDFARIPTILASYRVHEDSASFRFESAARSEEIIAVVEDYWRSIEVDFPPSSLAKAYMIASKNHLQSLRLRRGGTLWYKAIMTHPSTALEPAGLRMIFAGLLRRAAYSLRSGHRRKIST
jgi:glycosyltransferase involved in cell wall biosynthesis